VLPGSGGRTARKLLTIARAVAAALASFWIRPFARSGGADARAPHFTPSPARGSWKIIDAVRVRTEPPAEAIRTDHVRSDHPSKKPNPYPTAAPSENLGPALARHRFTYCLEPDSPTSCLPPPSGV